MSLTDHRVTASVAVTDLPSATEFYEGTLGLTPDDPGSEGYRVYACGGGTSLHVYASPAHAGKATATIATWHVPDLEPVVDELTARGLAFERYDAPATDAKGIHDGGYVKVAWFTDPDGNTFAVEQ